MADKLSCGCYRDKTGRRFLCAEHAALHFGGIVPTSPNVVALLEALTYHVIRIRDNEDARDELRVALAKVKLDAR